MILQQQNPSRAQIKDPLQSRTTDKTHNIGLHKQMLHFMTARTVAKSLMPQKRAEPRSTTQKQMPRGLLIPFSPAPWITIQLIPLCGWSHSAKAVFRLRNCKVLSAKPWLACDQAQRCPALAIPHVKEFNSFGLQTNQQVTFRRQQYPARLRNTQA